ncbi:MAG: hypothetical protein HOH77_13765, partial [Candidatus Latescibacteria bacterium]|nr:hypothetical protein [Candidatus Latescibacterota bacterium]
MPFNTNCSVYVALTRSFQDAHNSIQVHSSVPGEEITFLRAYRGLSGFRGEAAFSTWLMQIALNVCTTHLRAKQA